MNRRQKIVLAFTIAVIVLTLAAYLLFGDDFFTKTRVLVERKDPLFGNTVKEWEEGFVLGLDIPLTVSAAAVIAGGILMYVFRKKN